MKFIQFNIPFEDLKNFPLDLLENESRRLPIFLSKSDSSNAVAFAHGFRVNSKKNNIEMEIVFITNTKSYIAKEYIKNNLFKIKLNPFLKKHFLDDEFYKLELVGFTISEISNIDIISEYRYTKKSFVDKFFTKFKKMLKIE